MRAILILVLSAALLQGCGTVRGWFDGSRAAKRALPYATKLDAGETRRDFTVTVASRGAPLEAVRESARYPATAHCMHHFGVSDIDWVLDATGSEWAVSRTEDGSLLVRGRCTGRA